MSEQHVKGLAELQKVMDQLPAKLERNVMRGALRAGMKVIQPVAKANIHSVSGQLAAGLKIGTKARGGTVLSYLRAGGPHGYLAKWVEFGTRAHNISAKKGGWLSFMNVFTKTIAHPGARPKPFLRPALDGQASAAVNAAAAYMRARLASKHGLDTSDVRLEGDE